MFFYILVHSNSNPFFNYDYCMGAKSFYFCLDSENPSADIPQVI